MLRHAFQVARYRANIRIGRTKFIRQVNMARRNQLDRKMRRAREGADALLSRADPYLPDDALNAMRSLEWPITSPDHLRVQRAAILERAKRACETLAPERAIPIIVDATSRHYSLTYSTTSNAAWLGSALKACMTLTWPNIYRASPGRCTIDALWHAIGLCGAHQQLYNAQILFAFAGDTGRLDLAKRGIVFSPELARIQEELVRAKMNKAFGLRSPTRGASELALSLADTSLGIMRVIDGAPPAQVPEFANTLLAYLKPGMGRELLAHLWLTNQIAHAVGGVSTRLHGHNEGVVLIPHPVPILRYEPLIDAISTATSLLFWTQEWHRSLAEGDITNAVVDRPLLRCDVNGGFYATSLIFVLDALAWGIEAAFFGYPRMEKLHLPKVAFEAAFSGAFEASVVDICRKAKLVAGTVEQTGVWKNQSETVILKTDGLNCPGEIDCLAVTADRRTAFVLECKVLRLPLSQETRRNLEGKLGLQDDEGFHRKLTLKAEWVRKATGITDIRTAIIVDTSFPIAARGRHQVLLDTSLPGHLEASNLREQ